jgi:adenylate kinase family enzyme
MAAERPRAERILIVGGSGSGKTTLATRLAEQMRLPVHHLDQIARVGGGLGPERSAADRSAAVRAILTSDRWIVEGIHLGWTDELLQAAEVIVWLDHVSWPGSSVRIVKRFVQQAVAEARRQRGHRRFIRFRDYARQLRWLLQAIPESRGYATETSTDDDRRISRASTRERLQAHSAKLIHCSSASDVEEVVRNLMSRRR